MDVNEFLQSQIDRVVIEELQATIALNVVDGFASSSPNYDLIRSALVLLEYYMPADEFEQYKREMYKRYIE